MQKLKIIIALVAVAAITIAAVGLAAAQTTAPTPNTNTGFWGWIGNCFRYRTTPPVTAGTQVQTPTAPTTPSGPTTTVPPTTVPNQGSYYRGYGPCWGRW
jgi:hypothetical protein